MRRKLKGVDFWQGTVGVQHDVVMITLVFATHYGPHGQHGTVKGSGAWTSWTAWWKKKALSHELDEEVVKITDLLLILKHRFQKKT